LDRFGIELAETSQKVVHALKLLDSQVEHVRHQAESYTHGQANRLELGVQRLFEAALGKINAGQARMEAKVKEEVERVNLEAFADSITRVEEKVGMMQGKIASQATTIAGLEVNVGAMMIQSHDVQTLREHQNQSQAVAEGRCAALSQEGERRDAELRGLVHGELGELRGELQGELAMLSNLCRCLKQAFIEQETRLADATQAVGVLQAEQVEGIRYYSDAPAGNAAAATAVQEAVLHKALAENQASVAESRSASQETARMLATLARKVLLLEAAAQEARNEGGSRGESAAVGAADGAADSVDLVAAVAGKREVALEGKLEARLIRLEKVAEKLHKGQEFVFDAEMISGVEAMLANSPPRSQQPVGPAAVVDLTLEGRAGESPGLSYSLYDTTGADSQLEQIASLYSAAAADSSSN